MITRKDRFAEKGCRIFTREEIENAMRHSKSNAGAARYLQTTTNLYKRSATLYYNEEGISLYEAHWNYRNDLRDSRIGTRLKKLSAVNRKKEIIKILSGDPVITSLTTYQIKKFIRETKIIPYKCKKCGFCSRRLVDNRSPLILVHKDGNGNNWSVNNLFYMCYNCSFLYHEDLLSGMDKLVWQIEDWRTHTGSEELDKTFKLSGYQKAYLKSMGIEGETSIKPVRDPSLKMSKEDYKKLIDNIRRPRKKWTELQTGRYGSESRSVL